MFDELVDAATGSRAPAAVGAWARVENAACARRLSAIADELERLRAADGSADRELWCIDNWDAVAASVAAAQNVSLGVASHQLSVALELRDLPRVAQVFAAGAISLSSGGRGDRADPADPRSRRPREGRQCAGRAHQRVGAAVGGENRDRDRLLGGPLRSRRAAAQRGPRPRPLRRCP